MRRGKLVDDSQAWAASCETQTSAGAIARGMEQATKLHGLDGVHPTPAGFEEAQGYIAMLVHGSIGALGFNDLLGPRKHVDECATYLTCEQAVQLAGRLMQAVAESQRRLAAKRLEMGDES